MAIGAEGYGHYTEDIPKFLMIHDPLCPRLGHGSPSSSSPVMIVLPSDFQTYAQNHVLYSPRDKLKPVPSHRVSCIFEMLHHFLFSAMQLSSSREKDKLV